MDAIVLRRLSFAKYVPWSWWCRAARYRKALAAGMPVIKRLEELASDRDKAFVTEAARKGAPTNGDRETELGVIGGDSRSSSMTQILDCSGAVVSGWTV